MEVSLLLQLLTFLDELRQLGVVIFLILLNAAKHIFDVTHFVVQRLQFLPSDFGGACDSSTMLRAVGWGWVRSIHAELGVINFISFAS